MIKFQSYFLPFSWLHYSVYNIISIFKKTILREIQNVCAKFWHTMIHNRPIRQNIKIKPKRSSWGRICMLNTNNGGSYFEAKSKWLSTFSCLNGIPLSPLQIATKMQCIADETAHLYYLLWALAVVICIRFSIFAKSITFKRRA